MNLLKIIDDIDQTEKFSKYTEFKLTKLLNIKNKEVIDIINNLNLKDNIICLYNSRTHIVDNIGVIDIDGKRYIDFDDDNYTMTNKGICKQIDAFIE